MPTDPLRAVFIALLLAACGPGTPDFDANGVTGSDTSVSTSSAGVSSTAATPTSGGANSLTATGDSATDGDSATTGDSSPGATTCGEDPNGSTSDAIHDPAVDHIFLQTTNLELLTIAAGTGELLVTTPIVTDNPSGFINPVLVP